MRATALSHGCHTRSQSGRLSLGFLPCCALGPTMLTSLAVGIFGICLVAAKVKPSKRVFSYVLATPPPQDFLVPLPPETLEAHARRVLYVSSVLTATHWLRTVRQTFPGTLCASHLRQRATACAESALHAVTGRVQSANNPTAYGLVCVRSLTCPHVALLRRARGLSSGRSHSVRHSEWNLAAIFGRVWLSRSSRRAGLGRSAVSIRPASCFSSRSGARLAISGGPLFLAFGSLPFLPPHLARRPLAQSFLVANLQRRQPLRHMGLFAVLAAAPRNECRLTREIARTAALV